METTVTTDEPLQDLEVASAQTDWEALRALRRKDFAAFLAGQSGAADSSTGLRMRPGEPGEFVMFSEYLMNNYFAAGVWAGVPLAEQGHSSICAERTVIQPTSSDQARLQLEEIFRAGSWEEFEDGMDNAFTQRLLHTVRQHGDIAVNELAHLILNEHVACECAGEALKWLGDMEHEPTRVYRRWLLEKALVKCPSMIARDGANVGLALMDDPHAIPFLKKAIEASASPLFSEMLLQTLHQLEETRNATASPDDIVC